MGIKDSIKEMKPFTKILLFGVFPVLVVSMGYFKMNRNENIPTAESKDFFTSPELTDTFKTKSNIDLFKEKKLGNKNNTFGSALTYETKTAEQSSVDSVTTYEKEQQNKTIVAENNYLTNRGFQGNKEIEQKAPPPSNNYKNNSTSNKQPKTTVVSVSEEVSTVKRRRNENSMGNMNAKTSSTLNSTEKINAVIHNDNKLVKAGNTIRIRIIEDCVISGNPIKTNTMISGIAEFTAERLKVVVTSINYEGKMFACNFVIYDNDGIEGLYVPGGLEIEKDVANEGIEETSAHVNIPVIGSVSTGAFKKKVQDPSVRVYDNHKVTLRIPTKK